MHDTYEIVLGHKVDNVMHILTFYNATKIFSYSKYPTRYFFIGKIFSIVKCFTKCRPLEMYQQFIPPIEIKFRKYWIDIPMLYLLIVALDLMQKWEEIEYFLEFYEMTIGVNTQETK